MSRVMVSLHRRLMSRVIGDSRGPVESADCRPSRRHWSAHRHRGSKDGLFVASTSAPAAQAQNQAGLPVPSTIRASYVIQLAASCC